MAITTKITFWVICFSCVTALMTDAHVLPNINTQPGINTTEFADVADPGEHQPDPWIGPWELIWKAASVFVGSFWRAFYVFGTIQAWGLPVEYAATAQGLIVVLYGYDLFAVWKGYEIL